jgi:hypothetical protein
MQSAACSADTGRLQLRSLSRRTEFQAGQSISLVVGLANFDSVHRPFSQRWSTNRPSCSCSTALGALSAFLGAALGLAGPVLLPCVCRGACEISDSWGQQPSMHVPQHHASLCSMHVTL